MNKRFSERLGFVEVNNELQIESMNDDLRNSLWNFLSEIFDNYDVFNQLINFATVNFFKLPIDEIPWREERLWFKSIYDECEWFEIYNLLECILNNIENIFGYSLGEGLLESFYNKANEILERELSAYRFMDGLFTPITNEYEMVSIKETKNYSSIHEKLKGVNEHIKMAQAKLSLKPEADYRNSIKESISAVESLIRKISGKSNLSEGLRFLKTKFKLHSCLQLGFEKLYNYSSDENGIRHAIHGDRDIGFDEAKYMLVSCSAFINYLIPKANEHNLL